MFNDEIDQGLWCETCKIFETLLAGHVQ